MKTFGRRLVNARVSKGISQAELARRLGLHDQSNLSRWERGLSEPGLLCAIRAALEVGLSPNQATLDGPLPVLQDAAAPAALTVEESEILQLVREMEGMVHDVDIGPLQVVLQMVRNSHRMIKDCTKQTNSKGGGK
jgi:transcriptional regulator with XRE-family HTH domain